MKHYLLILLLIFSSYLLAQPCLDSRYHLPRPDDHLIKQEVRYKSPGSSGSNILWDFSEQEAKILLPPYGDDPRDQEWIKIGFTHYLNLPK